jgi:hypothetical protein
MDVTTATNPTCSSSCMVAAKGKPSVILAIIVNKIILLCTVMKQKTDVLFLIYYDTKYHLSASHTSLHTDICSAIRMWPMMKLNRNQRTRHNISPPRSAALSSALLCTVELDNHGVKNQRILNTNYNDFDNHR